MIQPYASGKRWTLYLGDSRDCGVGGDVLITDPPYGVDGSSGTINAARTRSKYHHGRPDTPEDVRAIYVPVVEAMLARCGGRGAVTPGAPNAWCYPHPTDIGAIFQPACHGMSKWGRATWQPVLFYGRDPYVGLTIQPLHVRVCEVPEVNGHPCPKPMGIARWLVGRASRPGETVADAFVGSGTFGVAALLAGRRFVGWDIHPPYLDIAARRLEQAESDGVQVGLGLTGAA